MKTYSQIFICLVIVIFCSACKTELNDVNRSHPTPSSQSTPESHLDEIPTSDPFVDLISQCPYNQHACLSPDGNWIITQINPLMIISAQDLTTTLQVTDAYHGSGLFWSPDGSYIAKPVTTSMCGWSEIVLYHIVEQGEISDKVLELPNGDIGCLFVAWALDSSKFAVYNVRASVIYIYDSNANLLRILDLGEGDIFAPNALWTPSGFFVGTAEKSSDSEQFRSELRHYRDPSQTGEYQSLLSHEDFWIDIISINPDNTKLLLKLESLELKGCTFKVLDLKSKSIESEVVFSEDTNSYVLSKPMQWIAIMTIDPTGGDQRRLYIYDWQTGKFTDYGSRAELLGWSITDNGFVVVNTKDAGGNIEVVKP